VRSILAYPHPHPILWSTAVPTTMPTLNSPDLTAHPPAPALVSTPLQLDRLIRWEVYHRLQALEIPCQCGVNHPLTVTTDTPLAITQVWSVVKAATTPKADLAAHLNRCWQQRISL
jgi:hypothetical protein